MSWEPHKTLYDIKVDAIASALDYFGGNKSHAAKDLGISLRSLRTWVAISDKLSRFRQPAEDTSETDEPDEDLPIPHEAGAQVINLRAFLAQIEIQLIVRALRKSHWRKAPAARLLGLNRTTLVEKIKKYRIKPRLIEGA